MPQELREHSRTVPPTGEATCDHGAGRLEIGPRGLACSACGRRAAVGRGVIDLASADFYWNQIPREAMEPLLADAALLGWRAALERHLRPRAGDYVFEYAVDERRADFACLLPRGPSASVLDVGCGWGAVTAGLARACGEVVSVDSTLETLCFVAERLAQEGLDRVTLARIDPLGSTRLPFPSARFDAVVLNGVLEWVGQSRTDRPVVELQTGVLEEARRCLRPGGVLYVGIENRFGLEALLGARDHNGLRFTSLMPRWLARAVSRTAGAGDYRTFTHSMRGYRRLFSRAGFADSDVHLYLPKPSYRQPRYILPADRGAIAYYFRSVSALAGAKRGAARLLAALGVHPWVADSFGWLARVPS
jgi:SAM-dependent methyltransferase